MFIDKIKWPAILALIFIISVPARHLSIAAELDPSDTKETKDPALRVQPSLNITGYDDAMTKAEVSAFQKTQGFKTTGQADQKTLKALGFMAEPGDSGKHVSAMQRQLSKKEDYKDILKAVKEKHNPIRKDQAETEAQVKEKDEGSQDKAQTDPPEQKAEKPAVRTLKVKATAYTAHCPGCSGITKTGVNLLKHPDMKVIAVDPDVIPLGSTVYVPGYGYALAADTGGAIDGHHIDIYIENRSDALKWGVKHLTVKIVKED